jgi:hypothetical protein
VVEWLANKAVLASSHGPTYIVVDIDGDVSAAKVCDGIR